MWKTITSASAIPFRPVLGGHQLVIQFVNSHTKWYYGQWCGVNKVPPIEKKISHIRANHFKPLIDGVHEGEIFRVSARTDLLLKSNGEEKRNTHTWPERVSGMEKLTYHLINLNRFLFKRLLRLTDITEGTAEKRCASFFGRECETNDERSFQLKSNSGWFIASVSAVCVLYIISFLWDMCTCACVNVDECAWENVCMYEVIGYHMVWKASEVLSYISCFPDEKSTRRDYWLEYHNIQREI